RLRQEGREAFIRERTGLLIDSYFSATKAAWLLQNVPGAREQAERGELAFGTVDTWLMWQLTGGALHATDVTNASRTMLFNVRENRWDEDLLALFGVPLSLMPKVLPSSATYGETSAALLGAPVAIGAVVQWLRDGLKAITSSTQVQSLAESVPDAGGVMMVPAFTGLGAPYWKPDARGTITGLTRGTSLAHIARAALESIAYQSAALLQAMSRDAVAAGAAPVSELRVDGGAAVNDLLMQFQADLLG